MEAIDRGDTAVGIAGDWHGNTGWALRAIAALGAVGVRTLYHLGDFGIWPGASGKKYLDKVNKVLVKHDIRAWVTPGNHENWFRLSELFARDDGAEPAQLESHIWILPRGFCWMHAGRSFVSLGGAPSIDREYRTLGRSWWIEEAITEADVERVAAGGHADVMLAHDAPRPASPAVEIARALGGGGGVSARMYASEGVYWMSKAHDAVLPELLLHGHYHVADTLVRPDGRRVVGLGMDGDALGNLALLGLTDLSVSPFPVRAPLA